MVLDDGKLPSLASLNTGMLKQESPPYNPMSMRTPVKPPPPPPVMPLYEEGDRIEPEMCYQHVQPHSDTTYNHAPFAYAVLQRQAQEWFNNAPRTGASGIYGETRIVRGVEMNDTKMDLLVKKWSMKIPDPRVAGDSFKAIMRSEKNRIYPMAKKEVDMHLEVHKGLEKEGCYKYLSIPACMDWRTNDSIDGVYTVQSVIGEPGMRTCTLGELLEEVGYNMKKLPVKWRYEAVSAFGEMLACIHATGILHHDMHIRNIMVVTNLPDGGELEPDTFELHWRIVDWGLAMPATYGTERKYPTKGAELCSETWWGELWKFPPAWRGRFCHYEARVEAFESFANLIADTTDAYKGLISEKEKLERTVRWMPEGDEKDRGETRVKEMEKRLAEIDMYEGAVTHGVIYAWLRNAYAKGMEMTIPKEIQDAVKERLAYERTIGGAGVMPDVD